MTSQESHPSLQDYYHFVNQHRFTVELEFVSSLASPAYLAHLSSQGYLQDARFIRYLAYLHQTWSQPRYASFLRFPNALLFCKALAQSPTFRSIVGTDGWEQGITKDILLEWSRDRHVSYSANEKLQENGAGHGFSQTEQQQQHAPPLHP